MKYLLNIILLFAVAGISLNCQNTATTAEQTEQKKSISFTIKNPTSFDWQGQAVEVPVEFVTKEIQKVDWAKVGFSDGAILPIQWIDEDQNGTPEVALLLVDLKSKEEKTIKVSVSEKSPNNTFTKRTQAEIAHKVNGSWEERKYKEGTFKNVTSLRVPPEHTDHSEFIRYEGPGWESDKVGYRFYLDWRNAVDIFGKKTPDMVLQKVGLDGFDSYHEASDWGMDVLKVGKSLGIGSIGFWENGKATRVEKTDSLYCEIAENGVLQSKIKTVYSGWQINDQKLDLTSELSIRAGSRMTLQDIVITKALPNICTGIVKHDNVELIQKTPTDKTGWGYLATFGKQSLAEDNLGMVIFFRAADLLEIQEDADSYVVVLKPEANKLSYYFAAAWEQEPQGIKTLEAFKVYLENQIEKLNAGVVISH